MNHKKLPLQIFLIVVCLLFTTQGKTQGLVYSRFVESLIADYLYTKSTIPNHKTLKSIEMLLEEADYNTLFIKAITSKLYELIGDFKTKTRYMGKDQIGFDLIKGYFQEANDKYKPPVSNKFINKFEEPKVLTEATLFNALILKKTMELFLEIKNIRKSKPFYSNLSKRLKKTFNKISGKLSPESDLMQSIAFQLNTLAISTDFFRENSWKFPEIEEYFNNFMSYLNDSEKHEFQKLLRLELRETLYLGVAFDQILLNQDTIPQQIISLYHILQNTYFQNAEIKVKSNQSDIQKDDPSIQIEFIDAVINKTIKLIKEQGLYQKGDEYIKELAYCQAVNNLLSSLCQNQN